ncbi:Nif11-like leader peptide family RiPP precursor [Jiella marina]|uniref:Nif11-like leader peptide family RiPP precursor n=1 Tax=Jiella sp. LLJ827 TaxID=2917712 RepID=UPI00210138D3|nr:Nif11-like leader peptide family RiPP precursor [Jiella sp. LLJ827]MCQ0988065.1 Nif11-like leader peptide family RiPP precursor [Jiella sp. LLJ827]
MTMNAMNDFVAAVRNDETMAPALATAIEGRSNGDAAEAFAAFARQQDFEVTVADVEAARRPAANGDALSDDELDAASGGWFDFGFWDTALFSQSSRERQMNAMFPSERKQ